MIYYRRLADPAGEITIWSCAKTVKEMASKIKRQAAVWPDKYPAWDEYVTGKRCKTTRQITVSYTHLTLPTILLV